MAVIQRITDFIPNTLIVSQEVDGEFNQLVNLLSGVSDDNDTILKYSHATDPVLKVDQLGAGLIQQWAQNGTVKSRINNNGSLESIAGPVIAASQLIAAPLTIDGSTDIVMKANGQIVGYARTIQQDSTPVGNVGAGLDVLQTFTLPAASLAAANDFVEADYFGQYASNNNDKRVVWRLDGTLLEDTGLIDIDSQGWHLKVKITRLTDVTVRVQTVFSGGVLQTDSAGTNAATGVGGVHRTRTFPSQAISDLDVTGVVMRIEGESGAGTTDDVINNESVIKLTQMS